MANNTSGFGGAVKPPSNYASGFGGAVQPPNSNPFGSPYHSQSSNPFGGYQFPTTESAIQDDPSRTWGEATTDTLTTLGSSLIGAAASPLGVLSSIPGVSLVTDPWVHLAGQAQESLQDWGYSDQKKALDAQKAQEVADAYLERTGDLGFWGNTVDDAKKIYYEAKAGGSHMLTNPSQAIDATIGSLPYMAGGGVVSRLLPKAYSAPTRASAGEGFISAGDTNASIIQEQGPEGSWGPERLLSLASGGVTGLIGRGGSRLQGNADIDTLLAGGGQNLLSNVKGPVLQAARGIGFEGVEEALQGAQEQGFQNVALGRPWADNVGSAAVEGMVAGSPLGGLAGIQASRMANRNAKLQEVIAEQEALAATANQSPFTPSVYTPNPREQYGFSQVDPTDQNIPIGQVASQIGRNQLYQDAPIMGAEVPMREVVNANRRGKGVNPALNTQQPQTQLITPVNQEVAGPTLTEQANNNPNVAPDTPKAPTTKAKTVDGVAGLENVAGAIPMDTSEKAPVTKKKSSAPVNNEPITQEASTPQPTKRVGNFTVTEQNESGDSLLRPVNDRGPSIAVESKRSLDDPKVQRLVKTIGNYKNLPNNYPIVIKDSGVIVNDEEVRVIEGKQVHGRKKGKSHYVEFYLDEIESENSSGSLEEVVAEEIGIHALSRMAGDVTGVKNDKFWDSVYKQNKAEVDAWAGIGRGQSYSGFEARGQAEEWIADQARAEVAEVTSGKRKSFSRHVKQYIRYLATQLEKVTGKKYTSRQVQQIIVKAAERSAKADPDSTITNENMWSDGKGFASISPEAFDALDAFEQDPDNKDAQEMYSKTVGDVRQGWPTQDQVKSNYLTHWTNSPLKGFKGFKFQGATFFAIKDGKYKQAELSKTMTDNVAATFTYVQQQLSKYPGKFEAVFERPDRLKKSDGLMRNSVYVKIRRKGDTSTYFNFRVSDHVEDMSQRFRNDDPVTINLSNAQLKEFDDADKAKVDAGFKMLLDDDLYKISNLQAAIDFQINDGFYAKPLSTTLKIPNSNKPNYAPAKEIFDEGGVGRLRFVRPEGITPLDLASLKDQGSNTLVLGTFTYADLFNGKVKMERGVYESLYWGTIENGQRNPTKMPEPVDVDESVSMYSYSKGDVNWVGPDSSFDVGTHSNMPEIDSKTFKKAVNKIHKDPDYHRIYRGIADYISDGDTDALTDSIESERNYAEYHSDVEQTLDELGMIKNGKVTALRVERYFGDGWEKGQGVASFSIFPDWGMTVNWSDTSMSKSGARGAMEDPEIRERQGRPPQELLIREIPVESILAFGEHTEGEIIVDTDLVSMLSVGKVSSKKIKLTPAENKFFKGIFGNKTNISTTGGKAVSNYQGDAAELKDAAPSVEYSDGYIYISEADIDGLGKYIDEVVTLRESDRLPPRFYNDKFMKSVYLDDSVEMNSVAWNPIAKKKKQAEANEKFNEKRKKRRAKQDIALTAEMLKKNKAALPDYMKPWEDDGTEMYSINEDPSFRLDEKKPNWLKRRLFKSKVIDKPVKNSHEDYKRKYKAPEKWSDIRWRNVMPSGEFIPEQFRHKLSQRLDSVNDRLIAKTGMDLNNITIDGLTGLKDKTEYLRKRYLMMGRYLKADKFADAVYKTFRKADPEHQAHVFSFLNGDITLDQLKSLTTADIADVAGRLRSQININAKHLVRAGALRQETVDQNPHYLPRMYLKHVLNKEDRTALSGGGSISAQNYLKPRKLDPKKPKDRATMDLLGEIVDPGFLGASTISAVGRDVATIDFLDDLATHGNHNWVLPQAMVRVALDIVDGKPTMKTVETGGKLVTSWWLRNEAREMASRERFMQAEGVTRSEAKANSEAVRLAMIEIAEAQESLMESLNLSLDDSQNIYRKNSAKSRDKELRIPMAKELTGMSEAQWKRKIKNYRQVPNSAKYGALAGMYIDKRIYNDLFSKSNAGASKEWQVAEKIHGWWKIAKVPANPPTVARNIISNFILMTVDGINPLKAGVQMGRAFKIMQRKEGRAWEAAKKYGIDLQTFSSQEMSVIQDEYRKIDTTVKNLESGQNIFAMAKAIGNASKTGALKVADLYGKVETWQKLAVIDHWMTEGATEWEAVLRAQEALFDYSLLNKSAKAFRKAPIGAPFLSFTLLAAKRMGQVIARNPLRLAYWAFFTHLLWAGSAEVEDVDEDDLKDLHASLAPYLSVKPSFMIAPMPYRDSEGRMQFIDLSYMNPFGIHTEMLKNLSEGELVEVMKAIGFTGAPLVQIVLAIHSGEDPFTGKKITSEHFPLGVKTWDRAKYLYRQFMPSLFTSQGAFYKMYQSYTEYVGSSSLDYGETKHTMGQAIARLIGINTYGVDPETSARKNLQIMNFEMQELQADYKRKIRDAVAQARQHEGTNKEQKWIDERDRLIAEMQIQIKARLVDIEEMKDLMDLHPNLKIKDMK